MNYKKLYDSIIQNRKQNPIECYTETHHIIPKSLGGTNDKENLVDLTAREYFICHLLLTKMYSEDSIQWIKMMKAFTCMLFRKANNQKRYINSHWYAYWRESFSKAQSLNQLSINNSCYGRCWVINPITEEKKSIKKDLLQEYLDNGWLRGRTLNESYRMAGGKYKKLSEEQKQENKLKRIEKQRQTNKKKGKFFCYINKQTKERKFFTEKEKPDLTIWEPTWSKFNIEEIKKFLKEKKNWYQIAEYYGTTYWSIYSWYRDNKNRFI